MEKDYKLMTSSKGKPQRWDKDSKTMMLLSDYALVEDPKFKELTKKFAKD